MMREKVDPRPILRDPARLAALKRTGLLDTPAEAAFDRLTQLARRLLQTPMALITLVDDQRQFFKSSLGLREPWSSRRQTPLNYSICQYTVVLGETFVVDDAPRHPLLQDHLAILEMDVAAYAGVPLRDSDGHNLGSLAVLDVQPRTWTEEEIATLQDLAAAVMTEIHLREERAARQQAESNLAREQSLLHALMNGSPDAIYSKDRDSRFTRINPAHAKLVGLDKPEEAIGKSDFDFHTEALARKTRADEQQVMDTGEPFVDPEEFNPTSEGEPRWFSVSKVPLWDAEGRVIGIAGISRNITKRKLAELALQESEERHRVISELTSDNAYVFAVQPDGSLKLEWATGPIVEMTGYTWEELVGISIYHPEDAARVREDVQKTIAGQPTNAEYRIITKSGEIRWSEIRRYPVYDAQQGRVTRFYGLARDITERKQAEAALRESETRYRRISELVSDLAFAFTVHPDGSFTPEWTVGSFLGMTGYAPEEIGSTLMLYHPDDADRVASDLQAVLSGQTVSAEYRIVTKNGEIRWAESYRKPEIVDGQVVRFYGAARDITARKQAEAALRESEARFSGIVNIIHEAIVSVDEDQRILIFNEGAEKIFGYSAAEVSGQPLTLLIPEEARSRHSQHLQAFADAPVAARSMGERGEIYGRRKDGQLFPAEASISKLTSGGHTIFTAVLRDISERKQAEDALKESEERFRQLTENLEQVFWMRDAESQGLIYISPAYARIWGRAPDELYTRLSSFLDTIHPDDRQWMGEVYQQQGRSGYDVQYRIVRPDGAIRWIWSRSIPLRDANGEVYRVVGIADDVTERKLADDALYESNERFRELTENLNQVFWIRDAETDDILYVSPAYEQVWGHSLADLHANPHSFDTVYAEDREWVNAVYDEKKKEGYDIEYRALHPDGSLHWIRSRAFPVRNAEGEVYRVAGIAEDITARKQAEDALRESEARFRQLAENLTQVFWMRDAETDEILYVSPAYEQISGRSPSELQKAPHLFEEMVHPEDREWVGAIYVEKKEEGYDIEYRALRPDGEVRWIWSRTFPVRNVRGEVYRVAGISEDITARKQAEAAYRDLVEQALQGIMVVQEGRIVFANSAWAEVVGYTREELLALEDPLTLIHPDDVARIGDYLERRLEGEAVPSRYELRMIRKDGEVRWLEQMASLVMYRGKPATQTASMDITERKLAEARGMALFREREKLNTLARFIGDISHDLRTPLSVIKSSVYLLGKQPDPEKRERHLTTLDHQVTHIGRVLEDMLAITRLDGATVTFDPQPHDLALLLAGIVEVEQKTAREKNQVLRLLPTQESLKVHANPDLLAQAVWQLLVNALTYTPEGGEITVEVSRRESMACVSVRDNGSGIPEEDLPHIFGAFYRVDKARGMDTGGTGLGLTITKKIVELHGGTISVESSVGAGSTFTIMLPIEQNQTH